MLGDEGDVEACCAEDEDEGLLDVHDPPELQVISGCQKT